jgi:hypothetical protein
MIDSHPRDIAARDDLKNKSINRSAADRHTQRLKETVIGIMSGTAHPFALCDVGAKAIHEGLPVHADILFAPEAVLRDEARFICLCFPTLRAFHGDARAWLARRLKRPEEAIVGSIPWNLAIGGVAINPGGD